MPFSSLVMSFSKFVSPGLPVQGPSEAHLQPVHSDQADPIGTVTQGDSAGGGEKQAEKATPHRSTYSEPEKKKPSHFLFVLEKPLVRMGCQLEDVSPRHMGWRNGAGGIWTPATSGPHLQHV